MLQRLHIPVLSFAKLNPGHFGAVKRRPIKINLFADKFDESFGAHRLGAFNGQTKSTIPDERSENSKGTRYAKQHSVVVHFCQTIVLEEKTNKFTFSEVK